MHLGVRVRISVSVRAEQNVIWCTRETTPEWSGNSRTIEAGRGASTERQLAVPSYSAFVSSASASGRSCRSGSAWSFIRREAAIEMSFSKASMHAHHLKHYGPVSVLEQTPLM